MEPVNSDDICSAILHHCAEALPNPTAVSRRVMIIASSKFSSSLPSRASFRLFRNMSMDRWSRVSASLSNTVFIRHGRPRESQPNFQCRRPLCGVGFVPRDRRFRRFSARNG